MAASIFDTARYQRLRRNFLIFLGACIAFSTVIYMPVYWLMYSDIRWNDSIPMLIWLEMVEPLMNYIFYLGAFTFLIHGTARFDAHKTAPFVGFFAGAAFLRYLTNVFSYIWIMGALHVSEWVTYDLPDILISTVFDCVQIGIAFRICYRTLAGKKYQPVLRVSDRVPTLRAAWLCAIIPAVTQVLSRFYYDMQMIFSFELQIDGGMELFLVISYYITDLLAIPVGFLVIALSLKWLSRAEQRAQSEYDSTKQK